MTFRSLRSGLFFLVALVLLFSPPARAAEPGLTKRTTVEGITEYSLPNGLRVLLFPDNSKPLVTVSLTVFVGSRHEGYGETGMAHLLEHMVFKGTPTHPNVPKALRDHGARFNGTTWVDRTNYFETMPASDANLEFGIKLEADRMVNSYVKREDLLSEMTVVRNEFESGENNPDRILSQRMMASAYEWHNYGKSTIGNRSDIERVPIDNLRAFYKKYYQPNNAMLVVAGKFDEKKALGYVVKYFGALKKPARVPENTYTQEPPQDGERTVTLRRVGSVGAVGAVYHIPAGAHPDYPAVAVLEDVLTSAPSGRLYKSLVKTKLANRVSGSAFAWHDPGVIEITASVEPDKIAAARKALLDTVENLAKEPITREEVERSKTRFCKDSERLLESSANFAVRLSDWAACGDWRLFFLNRDRLDKVTAAEVNKAAAAYLLQSNRTLGTFVPTQSVARADVPETPNVADLVKSYKGGKQVATGEAFDPTPENIEKRVVRGALPGGIKTALLAKKTRGEVVNLQLNLRFGNAESLNNKAVASELLGSLMKRGTLKHNRKEIQDELDRLGARLTLSSPTPGLLSASLRVKKANLPASLKLLQEMLREPSFAAEEFEILKRETLDRLQKSKTEPTALASNALQRALNPYPKDDVRYIPTIPEQIERTEATTLEQVKELHARQLGGAHGELAVVGDFEAEPTLAAVKAMTADWQSTVPYKRIARPANANVKGRTETILTPDKANAVYLAGATFPMTDADPDYPALELGNYLLGAAPLSSRLSNRVRGQEGLSYGIRSIVNASPIDKAGTFLVFAITNPKNIYKVDKAVGEEIDRFLKEGPSSEELGEGKRAYKEKLKVERSDDATLAQQLSSYLFVGRTYKFAQDQEQKIQDLEVGELRKVLEKYLVAGKRVTVMAGDFKKK